MGNANCSFENDTGANVALYVFNYADVLRVIPTYSVLVGACESVDCQAAAHCAGLILCIRVIKPGEEAEYHMGCGNGSHVKASQVLAAQHKTSRFQGTNKAGRPVKRALDDAVRRLEGWEAKPTPNPGKVLNVLW